MSLHGAPSALDLVVAVREFLERDVGPSVDGHLRFNARVAVNVLRIVERELELGPEQQSRYERGLERLGVRDERALAEAIKSGAVDLADAEVRAFLRETARARLAVANPGYVASPDAGS